MQPSITFVTCYHPISLLVAISFVIMAKTTIRGMQTYYIFLEMYLFLYEPIKLV